MANLLEIDTSGINYENVDRLARLTQKECRTICHHDFHDGNIVIGDKVSIIDWSESEFCFPLLSGFSSIKKVSFVFKLSDSETELLEQTYLDNFVDQKEVMSLVDESKNMATIYYGYTVGQLLRVYDESSYHLLRNQIEFIISEL